MKPEGKELKLRLRGNSLRMRVTRSEVERLCRGEAVAEATRFSDQYELRYELLVSPLESENDGPLQVSYAAGVLQVVLSSKAYTVWVGEAEVGIYATADNGTEGGLAVIVEKDFACLDRSHEENTDAFEHPKAGIASC